MEWLKYKKKKEVCDICSKPSNKFVQCIDDKCCPSCAAEWVKWEKAEESRGVCLACSHNPNKICHKDCPHYPAKIKREKNGIHRNTRPV